MPPMVGPASCVATRIEGVGQNATVKGMLSNTTLEVTSISAAK